jgi:hypothetical protein
MTFLRAEFQSAFSEYLNPCLQHAEKLALRLSMVDDLELIEIYAATKHPLARVPAPDEALRLGLAPCDPPDPRLPPELVSEALEVFEFRLVPATAAAREAPWSAGTAFRALQHRPGLNRKAVPKARPDRKRGRIESEVGSKATVLRSWPDRVLIELTGLVCWWGHSNFFGEVLGYEKLCWHEYVEALLSPQCSLFHSLHVALVRLLFYDLPATDQPFLGRPLNALTWPELLRQVQPL